MIRILIAVVGSFLALCPAWGQVKQSGTVTPRHAACWTTTGVIQDCGTAAAPFLTSIGTVGQGSTICANSAATTGAYNQLCLGANTASNATISLQNFGGASGQGLDFVINGTIISFPSSIGGTFVTTTPPATLHGMVCFSGTGGTVADCGLIAQSGTVTTGVWAATPVGVSKGGTGGTTAATARSGLGLGTISTQDANAVAITGGTITGLPTPSANSDAATKSYVDGLASGLTILASSNYATAAVLPNSPTYNNGTLGVGATLTAGSNTTLTVDGTVVALDSIVLVKNQASAAQNGIYKLTTAGDGSNAWVLTRATYFDQAAEMTAGSYTAIISGTANSGSSWILATTVTTVGSDSVTFNQFSSQTTASTVQFLQAGSGAVAWSVQSNDRQWVTVGQFAAVTGGSDVSTQIQNALSSGALSVCVCVPGTYGVSSTLSIPAGVTFYGLGKGATTLKKLGAGDLLHALGTSNKSNITIRDMTLDLDTQTSSTGLLAEWVTNLTISNVEVKNFTGWGIFIGVQDGTDPTIRNHNVILDNVIAGPATGGTFENIILFNIENSTVKNSVVTTNTSGHGVSLFQNVNGIILDNNTYTGFTTGSALYYTLSTSNITVTNSRFFNSASCLRGANPGDNGNFGFSSVKNLTVTNTLFKGCTASALQIGGVIGSVIANNTFDSNLTNSVYVSVANDVTSPTR
jgi:hypothetical protein